MANVDSFKKKFTRAEVESIFKKLVQEHEQTALKQKERIFELKEEVAELEAQLEEYRVRESQIAKALTYAAQKAADIENAARKKYDIEIEHLRIFHDKWKNYYNQLIARYPMDSNIAEVREFNREMTKILSGSALRDEPTPAPAAVFDSESERLRRPKKRVTSEPKPARKKSADAEPAHSRVQDELQKSARAKAPEELAFFNDMPPAGAVPPRNIIDFLQKEESAPTTFSVQKPVPTQAVPAGAFSLEEALNPTDDLEDIMRDLGLVFDGDIEQ